MFVCESCHKKSSKANDCYDCHGYGLHGNYKPAEETEIAEAVIRLIKTERELVRNAKEEDHGTT